MLYMVYAIDKDYANFGYGQEFLFDFKVIGLYRSKEKAEKKKAEVDSYYEIMEVESDL